MMLIDDYVPSFQFNERHSLVIDAEPAAIMAAIRLPETMDDPWIRGFIGLRELPARLVMLLGGKTALKHRPLFGFDDFVLLGTTDERETVFGLIGQFWRLDFGLVPCENAGDFVRFDRAGVAKLALNFTIMRTDQGCLVTTETRIHCNDPASQRRMWLYWLLIRPASGLIRRRMLRRLRKGVAR